MSLPVTRGGKPESAIRGAMRAAPAWLLALGAAAIAATAAMTALLLLAPEPQGAMNVLANTLDDVPIIFAAAAAAIARRGAVGRERRLWGCFAVGLASWLLGELIYDVRTLALGLDADASTADVFYVTYYPFAIAGLIAAGRRGKMRVDTGLLDSMIVALAAGLLLWQAVLAGGINASGSPLTKALNLAYPAFDVAIIWILARPLYERGGGDWTQSRATLAFGLVAVLVGDVLWLSGNDAAYSLLLAPAMLAIGLAAILRPRGVRAATAGDDRRRRQAEAALLIASAGIVVGLFLSRTTAALPIALGGALVIALLVLRVVIATVQNERLLSEAEARAGTDSLTGLLNHQSYKTRLGEEILHSGRREEPLALLLIDVDNFKTINDLGGHQVGDRILRDIARALVGACRATDAVCRIGGDEMAVIAPNTNELQVKALAERIRRAVAAVRVNELGESRQATLSIGCSVYPNLARDAGELVKQADVALYDVKQRSRDASQLFDPGRPRPVDARHELRRVNAELAAAKSDFRAVFAHAHDCMFITDDEGAIVTANAAAVGFFGLPREQLVGAPLLMLVRTDRRAAFVELMENVLVRGEATGQFELTLPNGREPIIEYATARVSPGRYLTVMRDITVRERNAADLQRSEAKFRAIFDNALDAMLISDDDGVIRGANRAACALAGRSLPELIGLRGEDLVPKDLHGEVQAAQHQILTEDALRGQMTIADSDGRLHTIEFTSVADFVPGRHLTIARDITDREPPPAARPSASRNGSVA